MKKLVVLMMAFASLLSVPAFAAKKRSMKANAEKIYSEKKAIEIAANYDLAKVELLPEYKGEMAMESYQDGYFAKKEFYVAKGNDNECVLYFSIKSTDPKISIYEITFSYCNLNGKASSKIQYVLRDVGTLYLNNKDKHCDLDSGSYELSYEVYAPQTIEMGRERAELKKMAKEQYGIDFLDEINPDQKKLIGSSL